MRVERVTHRSRAWISWAHATASDALSVMRGHLHALHLRHARRAAPHACSHARGAAHHPAGAAHDAGATHGHHAAPHSVACWTERAARPQTARKHRAAAARHSRGPADHPVVHPDVHRSARCMCSAGERLFEARGKASAECYSCCPTPRIVPTGSRVVRWMTGAGEAGRAVRGCASRSSSASRYAV
ncbi:hypothetical protein K523DRAFT_55202 [Schizophyllum commune Tattone D]|nr:hypothetical protein K523DRAFT_55202 [Schizophyllum commune Tattone D]